MKKTNLLFFTCLAFLFVVLFSSCDILGNDSSSSSNSSSSAQVRMYAGSGVSGLYLTVGTADSSSFSAATAWHYTSYNNYSSYTSVEPGSYYLIYDYSSDHSSAYVLWELGLLYLEAGEKYTCMVSTNGSEYTITPVED